MQSFKANCDNDNINHKMNHNLTLHSTTRRPRSLIRITKKETYFLYNLNVNLPVN
jgi:hypothetical protein